MRHQRGNLLKRELRLRSHPNDGTGGIAASLCRVSLSGLVCLSRLVYAWSEDKGGVGIVRCCDSDDAD